MLTDGKQIAAARQLLSWSQADLATRSGVSKPSIIRIEKDLMSVKDDLRKSIEKEFSNENLEFVDGGVRVNKKIVQIIEGNDCYQKILDDAYNVLSKTGGEFLKSGANEKRSSEIVVNKLDLMRKSGITFRSLLKNGDNFMRGPSEEYRWMDDSLYVESDVKFIYSNKVGYLMSWFNTYRIILIEDDKIAEENKRIFNFIWNKSTKPSQITKVSN